MGYCGIFLHGILEVSQNEITRVTHSMHLRIVDLHIYTLMHYAFMHSTHLLIYVLCIYALCNMHALITHYAFTWFMRRMRKSSDMK